MSFLSKEDTAALNWVKDNKDKIDKMKKQESIPTATVVEKNYDKEIKNLGLETKANKLSIYEIANGLRARVGELKANIAEVASVTTKINDIDNFSKAIRFNQQKMEEQIFQLSDNDREQLNKINALTEVVNENALNVGENVATAMKSAQNKQQKEITDRMKAIRNEFEQKQVESNAMLEETRNMLGTMRGLEFQLNQKVQDVLNARGKAYRKR